MFFKSKLNLTQPNKEFNISFIDESFINSLQIEIEKYYRVPFFKRIQGYNFENLPILNYISKLHFSTIQNFYQLPNHDGCFEPEDMPQLTKSDFIRKLTKSIFLNFKKNKMYAHVGYNFEFSNNNILFKLMLDMNNDEIITFISSLVDKKEFLYSLQNKLSLIEKEAKQYKESVVEIKEIQLKLNSLDSLFNSIISYIIINKQHLLNDILPLILNIKMSEHHISELKYFLRDKNDILTIIRNTNFEIYQTLNS